MCEDPILLARIVTAHPAVMHVPQSDATLTGRFLSHPIGFSHLLKAGYIERELIEWKMNKNVEYARDLDHSLNLVMFGKNTKRGVSNEFRLPIHFYSSLCALPEGLGLLKVGYLVAIDISSEFTSSNK